MPRFYFHLILEEKTLTDDDGQDLDTLAEARLEAKAIIRELVADYVHLGQALPLRYVHVVDGQEAVVAEIAFAKVLEEVVSKREF